jgi:hypothetical protein
MFAFARFSCCTFRAFPSSAFARFADGVFVRRLVFFFVPLFCFQFGLDSRCFGGGTFGAFDSPESAPRPSAGRAASVGQTGAEFHSEPAFSACGVTGDHRIRI